MTKDSDTLMNNQGSYHFMAPEMLSPDKKGFHGKISDIWALGVTFYAFTYLTVPFKGDDVVELMNNIKTQEQLLHALDLLRINFVDKSVGLIQFLSQFFIKNPNERPSLEQISNNEWLNKGHQNLKDEMQSINFYQLFLFREANLCDTQEITEHDLLNAYSIATYVMIVSLFVNQALEIMAQQVEDQILEQSTQFYSDLELEVLRTCGKLSELICINYFKQVPTQCRSKAFSYYRKQGMQIANDQFPNFREIIAYKTYKGPQRKSTLPEFYAQFVKSFKGANLVFQQFIYLKDREYPIIKIQDAFYSFTTTSDILVGAIFTEEVIDGIYHNFIRFKFYKSTPQSYSQLMY